MSLPAFVLKYLQLADFCALFIISVKIKLSSCVECVINSELR